MKRLTIVSLSTPETISCAAQKACEEASRLFLQTAQTPCAAPVAGLAYQSMDDLYAAADDFDALQRAIQERLFSGGEDVTYAVPGRVSGEQLAAISHAAQERGYCVRTIPGAGYFEAALPCDILAQNGFTLAAAADMPAVLDPQRALIIEELDTAMTAAEVKLRLAAYWPDEHPLTLCLMQPDGRYERTQVPLYMLDRLTNDRGFRSAHPAPYHAATVLYVPPCALLSLSRFGYRELEQVMERLRMPGGCPWDAEQTHESLKQAMIEECYEVLDAIDAKDETALCEELGDVLLQVVFHAEIEAERGRFCARDVTTGIVEKLIYRHPHVFGDAHADTPDAALDKWEELKKAEKHFNSTSEMMAAIPKNLPALMRAAKVQKKAAKVGFDWDKAGDALLKLCEEVNELAAAINSGGNIAEEMGDVLFAAVNVSRLLKLEPEQMLTDATEKFIRRFTIMEAIAKEKDYILETLPLDKQDVLWNEAKKAEKT